MIELLQIYLSIAGISFVAVWIVFALILAVTGHNWRRDDYIFAIKTSVITGLGWFVVIPAVIWNWVKTP